MQAITKTGSDLQLKDFIKAPNKALIKQLVRKAFHFKSKPFRSKNIGSNKTLVLLFFNPSLRTRLSTHKAALNLGMRVIDFNAKEGWNLEFEDDVVMNTDKAEHIREAAQVISQYADIIGIRSFPTLENRENDYQDDIINKFKKFASVPVISLESAIRHPLQSLADLMTIQEFKKTSRPKVVLTWAPHPKPLPQAVPNSFLEWMQSTDVDLIITHPKGYDLDTKFVINTPTIYNQAEAFENADFIYAKNWSSYSDYGKIDSLNSDWIISDKKMAITNQAYFMHCLPVRRNVVVEDKVLDSPRSLVIQQAKNREFAAQAVLHQLLTEQINKS